MKIYFLRHQAAGIVHKYPFSSPPTDEQRAAVERECFQQHGAAHPKTGESYWMTVVDVELVGVSDVIDVPERSLASVDAPAASAGAPRLAVEAFGTVRNPA